MTLWQKKQAPAAGLSPATSPVSEALILICEKCGKKLSRTADDNPSRTIQLRLKEEIRAEGSKGKLRCVLTGCMDVCPSGAIAVGISRTEKPDQFCTFKGQPEEAARVILEKIRKDPI
jgi:predicted metal-binding protein